METARDTTRGRPRVGVAAANAIKALGQKEQTDILTEVPPFPPSLTEYEQAWFTYYCELKLVEEDLRQQWIPLISLLCSHHTAEADLTHALSQGEIVLLGEGKAIKNPARERLLAVKKEILSCLGALRLTPKSITQKNSPSSQKKFVIAMPRSRNDSN